MIFCLALDCMFKRAEKKNGVARRWLHYSDKLKTDPNSLTPDEICDDHIITHMNSYVYECIKGIPPPEDDDKEEQPNLAIKPIKIKKNHYAKWNDDIMAELAKRKTQFPGIQEYIYPFFKVKTTRLKINTFTLPWGDRLLTPNDFLSEGEAKSFIKSHNNRYTLFVNQFGQFGVKDGNRVIRWYSSYRYYRDNYTFTIQSDGKLAIKNQQSTIYVLSITDETNFKGPLAIIIDNTGNLILYNNGFDIIKTNSTFKVTTYSFKSDIENINNYGLWSYIVGDYDPNNPNNPNNSDNSNNTNNSITTRWKRNHLKFKNSL